MAKDKLQILERWNKFQIGWFLAYDQEFGLMLGADCADSSDVDNETLIAMDVVKALPVEFQPDDITATEWKWPSQATVRKAVLAITATLGNHADGKPLPEWAVKASAEGWKPPAGWKP